MAYQKKYELFLKHWFADYQTATRGMSGEEKAVYIELRDTYWIEGCKPMALENLHLHLGVKDKAFARMLQKAKGVETDGTHIWIPALDRQRAEALKQSERQANRGQGKPSLSTVPKTNE